jgi:hypothetical protein
VTGPTADFRLPELGPWLGRLPEIGRRDRAPDFSLDPIRWDLVSGLVERADAARDYLAVGDRDGARAALDRETWLAVWRPAVTEVGRAVESAVASRVARAAQASGSAGDRVESLRLDAESFEVLGAKLDAAGIPLEREFDRPPADEEEWLAHIRRACRALETSWDDLESIARAELTERQVAIDELARSEPRHLWWWSAVAVAAVVAAWLGLTLGGYLPIPDWLKPFASWFWGLPWP